VSGPSNAQGSCASGALQLKDASGQLPLLRGARVEEVDVEVGANEARQSGQRKSGKGGNSGLEDGETVVGRQMEGDQAKARPRCALLAVA